MSRPSTGKGLTVERDYFLNFSGEPLDDCWQLEHACLNILTGVLEQHTEYRFDGEVPDHQNFVDLRQVAPSGKVLSWFRIHISAENVLESGVGS
jgi:hypothetical protein